MQHRRLFGHVRSKAMRALAMISVVLVAATILVVVPSSDSGALSPNVVINIDPANQKTIHDPIFGANNVWGELKKGAHQGEGITDAEFETFYGALDQLGMTMLRYPGGWESEWLDWQANEQEFVVRAEDGKKLWSNKPVLDGPEPQTVHDFLQADTDTQGLFVLPTQKYLCNPTEEVLKELRSEAWAIVKAYSGAVTHWEIGNEWFYMGRCKRTRPELLQSYLEVAREMTDVIWHVSGGTAQIYVAGAWYEESDYTFLRDNFGAGRWATRVAGVTAHVYTGHTPQDPPLGPTPPPTSQVTELLGDIAAAADKPVIVTEWAPSLFHNQQDSYLQAANNQIDIMYAMQQAEVAGATYWPPAFRRPEMALLDEHMQPTAVGTAFQWMSDHLDGKSVFVEQTIAHQVTSVAAAQEDNELAIFIVGKQEGSHLVSVRIAGDATYTLVKGGVSQVLYSDEGDFSSLGDNHVKIWKRNGYTEVRFQINVGRDGRGAQNEIAKIVLAVS